MWPFKCLIIYILCVVYSLNGDIKKNMNIKNFIDKSKSVLLKPLATVGFITVLIFGLWLTVGTYKSFPVVSEQIQKNVWPKISPALVYIESLFKGERKLVVALDKNAVTAGAQVRVTWVYDDNKGGGAYVFNYPCSDSYYLETDNAKRVNCDTSLDISRYKSINLIPEISGSASEIPISISYVRDNKPVATGDALLYVFTESTGKSTLPTANGTGGRPSGTTNAPPKTTTKAATSTQKTTTSATDSPAVTGGGITPGDRTEQTYTIGRPQAVNPSGKPDLGGKVLQIGILDKTANAFISTSSIKSTDRAAVRFEIMNYGDNKVDGWSFNAVLPTYPSNIFHSDTQQALLPGEKIEFTLGFNQLDTTISTSTIIITIDPSNSIFEKDEENNLLKSYFNISQ